MTEASSTPLRRQQRSASISGAIRITRACGPTSRCNLCSRYRPTPTTCLCLYEWPEAESRQDALCRSPRFGAQHQQHASRKKSIDDQRRQRGADTSDASSADRSTVGPTRRTSPSNAPGAIVFPAVCYARPNHVATTKSGVCQAGIDGPIMAPKHRVGTTYVAAPAAHISSLDTPCRSHAADNSYQASQPFSPCLGQDGRNPTGALRSRSRSSCPSLQGAPTI